MEPKVTIVIINWNGLADTIECIRSILQMDYSNYDIIVVDNNSANEETKQIRAAFRDKIRIVELRRNLGFAIANNVGIRIGLQAHSDYILLLNNDTIVDPSFLKELIDVSESKSSIGILGPKMYLYGEKAKLWYAGGKVSLYTRHTQEGAFKLDGKEYNNIKETDYVAGAGMLVKRKIFETIGLLPTEYFLGWEDIDFCIAARRKGYSCIYVPNSKIWHKVSASYKRHNLSYRQVYFGFRNRIMMRGKFLTRVKFLLFLLVQFLVMLPVHGLYYILIYKDPQRIVHMLKGIRAGFRDMRSRRAVYELNYGS